MSSSSTPIVFISAQNGPQLVLDIEGGKPHPGARVIVDNKNSSDSQKWVVSHNGTIASATHHDLVITIKAAGGKGSELIVTPHLDDVHDYHQQWEFHNGFIRSRRNHSLVLATDTTQVKGCPIYVKKLKATGNLHQLWNLKHAETGGEYTPIKETYVSDFDPSKVDVRLAKFWSLSAEFGAQSSAKDIFLNEIVSDRYSLVNGVQLLRDELQLAFTKGGDVMACAADLSVPTVITTLAHTNCGDRINQGRIAHEYDQMVASRFATIAEDGGLKIEQFSPAGGGTDDGGVLAHVTVAHQLDDTIRRRIYSGNKSSYILVNIDLMTHVGCDYVETAHHGHGSHHSPDIRHDHGTHHSPDIRHTHESYYDHESNHGKTLVFGKAKESQYREPRNACGAIIGTLTGYDGNNTVHRRLRSNLGEENYAALQKKIVLDDGTDITYVVAAAIVAIQGLHDTCTALTNEIDERGVGHLTASTTINSPGNEQLFYLARATVFNGKIMIQGFGLDATKYSGKVVEKYGKKRLLMTYDNNASFEIQVTKTTVKHSTSTTTHH